MTHLNQHDSMNQHNSLNQHAGFKRKKQQQLYPAQNPTSTSPLVNKGATYSNILCCNITIWRTEGVIVWS